MNYRLQRPPIRAWLFAAALSLAIGATALARAVGHARAVGTEIRRMNAALSAVIEAEETAQAAEGVVRAFAEEAGRERRGETPAAILRRLSPELPAEFTDPEILAETPAGRIIRQEWLLDDAAAEPVLLFAAVCERQRPPWQVESVRLQAVPGRPGRIRGGITFVGLAPPPAGR